MKPKKGMSGALSSLVVCAAAALAAPLDASAVGFGRARGHVVLGQPLDITLPLRLEAGETIFDRCVGARIRAGDRRIAPSAVRTRLDPGSGGGERLLRISTRSAIKEPVVDITVNVDCGSPVSHHWVMFADPPAAKRAPTAIVEPPTAAAAAPASATSAGEAPAPTADERARALEAELARLRAESEAQREALLQMRARGAEGELGATLLPWLLTIVMLLATLSLWLVVRMRRLTRKGESWWNSQLSSHAAESGSDPRGALASVTTGNAVFDVAARPAPRTGPPPADTAPAALQASSPPSVPNDRGRHAATVEEQIDLEQQADFFIVLGQDDAAIDLLLTHLRGTGGTSPMPYLKLLEIYRRTGDREAYERTRIRFNQRFNGVAPAWGDQLLIGRMLEDYPDVLQRLQRSWRSPLDAMAELESMLFRKGDDAPFDLPAYEEVLFLYQLARDLNLNQKPNEPLAAKQVDVLLAIDNDSTRSDFSVLQRGVERTNVLSPKQVSLDIDLSEPGAPPR